MFGFVDSPGLWVAPRTRHSFAGGVSTLIVSRLHREPSARTPDLRWPWVFDQPGRSNDLPAEETFSGFDELLLLDEVNDNTKNCGDDGTSSKVSREVRNACYSSITLDPAPAPELVILSEAAAMLTGIPLELARAWRRREGEDYYVQLKQIAVALTGSDLELFEGASPFASNYGGHQFGNWAGQLGDGRVCTLGEIPAVDNQSQLGRAAGMGCRNLLEIQLKGIGKTPFSRGGDGKAVLGTCLREFLFSEAFLGVGLPTAVSVSVCSTGETATVRDSDPKNGGALKRARGAVLCRAAPSFLRFGSFELPARRGDVSLVRKLADYCLRHLGPLLELGAPLDAEDSGDERSRTGGHIAEWKDDVMSENKEGARKDADGNIPQSGSRDDYLRLLVAIVQATAKMVAGWQAFGFCHGVLNTDNFTLLGFGLDFGPCSFMEKYDPAWSPNEGDSALRYTFQKQPDVSAWNCERLAEAFASIIVRVDPRGTFAEDGITFGDRCFFAGISGVTEANQAFSPAFDDAYTSIIQRKFGLFGMDLGSGWMHPSRSAGKGPRTTKDAQFVLEYFRLMSECRVDFSDTWRALLDVPASSVAGEGNYLPGPSTLSRLGKLEKENGPCAGLESESGERHHTIGTDGDIIRRSDEEVLRPLLPVLKAAEASGQQMQEWASWVREYGSRIDKQGIGTSHAEGADEGRRQRREVMRRCNPSFILRAKDLELALNAVESGDMALARQLRERLSKACTID